MSFKDKYTDDPKDTGRKLVSTDTYLLAELIELLIQHEAKQA